MYKLCNFIFKKLYISIDIILSSLNRVQSFFYLYMTMNHKVLSRYE